MFPWPPPFSHSSPFLTEERSAWTPYCSPASGLLPQGLLSSLCVPHWRRWKYYGRSARSRLVDVSSARWQAPRRGDFGLSVAAANSESRSWHSASMQTVFLKAHTEAPMLRIVNNETQGLRGNHSHSPVQAPFGAPGGGGGGGSSPGTDTPRPWSLQGLLLGTVCPACLFRQP